MSDAPIVSHGRGGTGNIGQDDTKYVDGGIHREGDPAASGIPYSTGRGGASNIASPAAETVQSRLDDDIVPEVTKVITSEGPYHGGRGGEGNIVPTTEPPKKKPHKAIATWMKEKLVAIARTAGRRKVSKPTVKVDGPKDEEKKEEKKEVPKVDAAKEAKEKQKEAPKSEKKEEVTTQESTAGPSEAEKPLEQAPATDATETTTAAPAAGVETVATKPEDAKA